MKIYNADKTPLNIIRFITTLITIALIILCRYFIPFYMLMIILITVFSLTGIILIFFYFPLMFKNIEFQVGENIIKKKQGVIFHQQQTINISSIQYITTAVCIFKKINGFNFIVLNIYGGIMILPFLSHKNFKEIMSEINQTLRK